MPSAVLALVVIPCMCIIGWLTNIEVQLIAQSADKTKWKPVTVTVLRATAITAYRNSKRIVLVFQTHDGRTFSEATQPLVAPYEAKKWETEFLARPLITAYTRSDSNLVTLSPGALAQAHTILFLTLCAVELGVALIGAGLFTDRILQIRRAKELIRQYRRIETKELRKSRAEPVAHKSGLANAYRKRAN